MPDFTVAQTIADQSRQAINAGREALSSVSSSTLTVGENPITGALGGIADKIKEAGASISGAVKGAYDSVGKALNIDTKFKDALGVAEKLKDIRPEQANGRVTESADQLQYPLDLGHYYIKFTFKTGFQSNPVVPRKDVVSACIYMPLPGDLAERYSVRYSEKELGILGLAEESGALNVAQDILAGKASKESLEALGKTLGQTATTPGAAAYLMRSLASGMGPVGTAIDRATGAVLNPYQALQFTGIDLRSHTFRFRCSPNSEAEAAALKAIINKFKTVMLPQKAGLLFAFPDVCTIEFSTPNMPYSFKNCYLKSMNVNYAPQGTPAFFKGGKYPAEVEISLDFGEIEPITRDDVLKKGGDLTQQYGQTSISKPVPSTTPAPVADVNPQDRR
jgi:hypothetical protein